jgi:hypothetical protein
VGSGIIAPNPNLDKELDARLGKTIEQLFGIEPQSLTAEESKYLIGFKSTDELRAAVAKAGRERSTRLSAKGISEVAPG